MLIIKAFHLILFCGVAVKETVIDDAAVLFNMLERANCSDIGQVCNSLVFQAPLHL